MEKKKIIITTDSTCDLPGNTLKQLNVSFVPLHVIINDKEDYADRIDITNEEIYKCLKNGDDVKTAAANPKEYKDFFTPFLNDGNEIIHLGVSETLSTGSANGAMIAANELQNERLHLIDSKNISGGLAMLVLKTASMLEQNIDNKDVNELIESIVNDYIPAISTHFIVESTHYLRKNGRVDNATGLIVDVFGKVRIDIVDGHAIQSKETKFYPGWMERAIHNFVDSEMKKQKQYNEEEAIITATYGINQKSILKAQKTLLEYYRNVIITEAGPSMLSHVGPAVALTFKRNSK